MRYAIFADVHSNLEALEAVEKSLQTEKIDACFCLGDIVGYGADPGKCIAKVKKLTSVITAGNHDWAVAEKLKLDYFNEAAREAVLWTRRYLNNEEKEFLSNLPLTYENETFILVHANLIAPAGFNYVLDVERAEENLKLQISPFCFIAHSHKPGIFVMDKNRDVFEHTAKDIKFEFVNKYLINVGSVGQPRDGNPKAAYCIFDTAEKRISIKRVEYDMKTACEKILKAGLPSILAYRLLEGK